VDAMSLILLRSREFLSVDELHTDVEIFGNIITLVITYNENISGHLIMTIVQKDFQI